MKNKALLFVAIHIASAAAYAVEPVGYALEDVIVTAQKTEETIQSVPISIQALDAKTLENNSINSFSDIRTLIPSLKITPYPTADQNLMINLRGQQPSALELTQDTPAAMHINGVYIARGNGLNTAVADLERIEVLRGPQGTLYGRNATAGAVNLVAAKPTNQITFKQQITVAEQDQLLSKTAINLPLTDHLFAKLAYLIDSKEGFVKNSAPNGIDFGDRDAQAARFDLRWQATDDLTIDYGYDWGYTRSYMMPQQCLQIGTAQPFASAMDPNQCSRSFKSKIAYYGQVPKNTVTVDGHTLSVEWELDALTLRSITAYRTLDDKYYGMLAVGGANFTGGAIAINLPTFSLPAVPDHTKQRQFSQELQLQGDLGDHLAFTAGLYYFLEHGSETQKLGSVVKTVLPIYTMVIDTGPRDLDGVVNESRAVFGQLTWTPPVLNGNLEIIPGIRFTKDSREASLYQRSNGIWTILPNGTVIPNNASVTEIGTPGAPAEFDKDFSKTTPSLTLQYRINGDAMAYAKYVKGYKSGGTAVRSSSAAAFAEGFGPETLTSVELGLKSSWLDQRLRVNADVFQSKFEDQQVSVRNLTAASGGVAVIPYDIVNAGKSTYQGAELEVQAAITDSLRISANYAYLHFEYDKVEAGSSGIDVTEFYHNRVPTNTYAVSADYTFRGLDIGQLNVNLNYSYTDAVGNYQDAYTITNGVAQQSAPTDTRQYMTPSYGLWNGRIALSDIAVGPGSRGTLTVALWGKNLADKKYVSLQNVTFAGAVAYQGYWGEPRTVGLDLIYSYE